MRNRILSACLIAAAVPAALVWRAQGTTPAPQIAADVSTLLKAGNFPAASALLKQYREKHGVNEEYLEAWSWMGRGELAAKNYEAALANAADVYAVCLKRLAGRKPQGDGSLATAFGASIEVTGIALSRQGRRSEAISYLDTEMEKWRTSSIAARIQKNINLLSLEGKPAFPLEVSAGVVGPKPRPLAAHAGHPVLLFFWAHWCSDCKAEAPILQRLLAENRKSGLEVIAPTQYYGYVAGGEEAPRATEAPYIVSIFNQYFSGLGAVETPLNNTNFVRYGVSTTPTLVMLNAAGNVTMYHPGIMTYDELTAAVRR